MSLSDQVRTVPKQLYWSLQWSEFMNIGKDVPEEDLIERIRGQAPNKCCTLIYTVSLR